MNRFFAGIFRRMLTVIGLIGSLVVVTVLVVLAVLLVSAVTMVALLTAAATLIRWRILWCRLRHRTANPAGAPAAAATGGLRLRLAGARVPGRLRADLSGNVPRIRRRLRLAAGSAKERPGTRRRSGGDSHRSRRHPPATAERHA
jgi:hypothetical protein